MTTAQERTRLVWGGLGFSGPTRRERGSFRSLGVRDPGNQLPSTLLSSAPNPWEVDTENLSVRALWFVQSPYP